VRRIVLVLLAGVSLGCTASLHDIRERTPIYTGDFPKPYQVTARCIFERLDAQTGSSAWSEFTLTGGLKSFVYRLDDPPDVRRARVNAISVGGPPSAEFEITVEPTSTGGSHVEYRRRWDGFRSTDWAAWGVATHCG
jgi:hypothetical protein